MGEFANYAPSLCKTAGRRKFLGKRCDFACREVPIRAVRRFAA
jgi:hypothetical protein